MPRTSILGRVIKKISIGREGRKERLLWLKNTPKRRKKLTEIRSQDSLIKQERGKNESLKRRLKVLHPERNWKDVPKNERRSIVDLEKELITQTVSLENLQHQRSLLENELKKQRKRI